MSNGRDRFQHPTWGIVELVRDFGSHVRIATKDGVQTSSRNQMVQIFDQQITVNNFRAGSLGSDIESAIVEDPIMLSDAPKLAAINQLSANQLAAALPNIGKVRAKQIVSAKPDGGYANFADLKEALPNLFNDDGNTDSIEWRELEPMISYAS
jgi:DNA uptake protein ComE-like DNA-binding protein